MRGIEGEKVRRTEGKKIRRREIKNVKKKSDIKHFRDLEVYRRASEAAMKIFQFRLSIYRKGCF